MGNAHKRQAHKPTSCISDSSNYPENPLLNKNGTKVNSNLMGKERILSRKKRFGSIRRWSLKKRTPKPERGISQDSTTNNNNTSPNKYKCSDDYSQVSREDEGLTTGYLSQPSFADSRTSSNESILHTVQACDKERTNGETCDQSCSGSRKGSFETNTQLPLIMQNWYHDETTLEEANKLLDTKPCGAFIIRPDEHNRRDLVLSLRHFRATAHIKAELQHGGKYVLGKSNRKFESASLMVQYYTRHPLVVAGHGCIYLETPLSAF